MECTVALALEADIGRPSLRVVVDLFVSNWFQLEIWGVGITHSIKTAKATSIAARVIARFLGFNAF